MDSGKWKSIGNIVTGLMEKKSFRLFLVAVGLSLILIIFLSNVLGTGKETGSDNNIADSTKEPDAQAYAKQLEDDLTELLRNIKHVGKVRVMVTIEKGVEHIYATEKKSSRQVTNDKNSDADTKNQQNDNTETTYILLKGSDGGQQAVSVTQIQPVVKGVVVVCDGGSDVTVKKQVTDAVTTALNISSAKVCVVDSK